MTPKSPQYFGRRMEDPKSSISYFIPFGIIFFLVAILVLGFKLSTIEPQYKLREEPTEDLNKIVFDLCIEKGGVPILDDWDEAVDCRFKPF